MIFYLTRLNDIRQKVKETWRDKLAEQPDLRQQVMAYVAADDMDLKKRIIAKMRSLNCSEDEAHDFYHQGFIQLEKKLAEKKLQGR